MAAESNEIVAARQITLPAAVSRVVAKIDSNPPVGRSTNRHHRNKLSCGSSPVRIAGSTGGRAIAGGGGTNPRGSGQSGGKPGVG